MRQSIRAIGFRNKVDFDLTKYSICDMHEWEEFLKGDRDLLLQNGRSRSILTHIKSGSI
ncbi:MAG: hypothetical protein WBL95_18820 [Microcoleus sp.]